MADELTRRLGRTVSAPWVRKKLFQARAKLGELLLSAVIESLAVPTLGAVEEELLDLGLMDYCQEALQQEKAAD